MEYHITIKMLMVLQNLAVPWRGLLDLSTLDIPTVGCSPEEGPWYPAGLHIYIGMGSVHKTNLEDTELC